MEERLTSMAGTLDILNLESWCSGRKAYTNGSVQQYLFWSYPFAGARGTTPPFSGGPDLLLAASFRGEPSVDVPHSLRRDGKLFLYK